MMTLQYRAVLNDPGDLKQDRPVQIFASSLVEVDAWAKKVLALAVSDDAVVVIHKTIEQQLSEIPKPKEKAESAGGNDGRS